MTYKALLIRACNGNGVGPSNYNRSSRNVEAPPPPPPASEPQPQREPFLPRLPPGYIYYGVQQNSQAQTSINDGAITGFGKLSPQTLSTLHELQRKSKRGKNFDVLTSIFYDKYSPGFEWLTDRWLAEKRILPEHTHRWLYYDPLGSQYRSKKQVLKFWKEQETTDFH